MNGITIRQAGQADALHIASIHCASWRDAYSHILDAAYLAGPIEDDRHSVWAERLENPDKRRVILLAEDEETTPVGFGCAYRDLHDVWGSLIDNLHVDPRYRGKAIGQRILSALASSIARESKTQCLHLWVFEANEAALRFYRRLGGEIVERTESGIPAANGATVLRIFWPDISVLGRCIA